MKKGILNRSNWKINTIAAVNIYIYSINNVCTPNNWRSPYSGGQSSSSSSRLSSPSYQQDSTDERRPHEGPLASSTSYCPSEHVSAAKMSTFIKNTVNQARRRSRQVRGVGDEVNGESPSIGDPQSALQALPRPIPVLWLKMMNAVVSTGTRTMEGKIVSWNPTIMR